MTSSFSTTLSLPAAITRRTCAIALATALWLSVLGSSAARAQPLPVPSAGLPGFLPGMKEVPDPGLVYKVVFDMESTWPLDRPAPALLSVARYLNSLAEYGVPPLRRRLVVVMHGGATRFVLNNTAFAAHNDGKHNPDAALIARMKQAGVDFRVCGQAVLAQHISPQDILPAVQMDLWALSTLVNLQLQGYVHIGG